ncbi:hypothetical protein M3Y99_01629400 [Aphelenchoides fujianensis]|nr:hypothetical protein M3Y99_01629400 [Aphelenchoides fujianensis]
MTKSDASNVRVTFVLQHGEEIPVSSQLHTTSGFLQDFLKTNARARRCAFRSRTTRRRRRSICSTSSSITWPRSTATHLKQHADNLEHWMSDIPSKKESLVPLAEGVHKDTLIRAANLADYLIVPSFLSFCTFVISEQCKNLNLADLREYLNEEDDFDEEQREIIRGCPEFANL